MRTLYVSDLDGTLLDEHQLLTTESRTTLNRLIAEGMGFTIATARSYDSVRYIVEGLNLQLPLILVNGVFIYDQQSASILRFNRLPQHAAVSIVEDYLQAGLHPLVYTLTPEGHAKIYYQGIFNESEEAYIANRLRQGDERFVRVDDYAACLNEQMITVNAIDVPHRLEPIYHKYADNPDCYAHFGPDIYAPTYHWLEICSSAATKKSAVTHLQQMLGYERLVVFGDNLNDLPMFEAADEKYAVSNAHPVVIAAADQTIGSNREDGVIRFLEGHFKGS